MNGIHFIGFPWLSLPSSLQLWHVVKLAVLIENA